MFERQCSNQRTSSLETPLWDVVETPVPELLVLLLAGLLRRIGPRRSRSQAAGRITGCFSPVKTMAVRRAGSGLASSNGIPGSPGSEESQNAGDIKRTLPCAERQSELHEKMTQGKPNMLTDLCNAKGHGAEKQGERNFREEHPTTYLNRIQLSSPDPENKRRIISPPE